jgi:hypothetical protein
MCILSRRVYPAPDFPGDVDDKLQLGPLFFLGE